MSPIEQVLAAAKSIAVAGHTPTLALIKGKLGTRIAMPTLIQGLQQFKAIPKEQWQDLPDLAAMIQPANTETAQDPLTALEQKWQAKFDAVESEFALKIAALEKRIVQLES
ncbi:MULTISPECIES: hypothetical protein [unclassified Shewanella]|uniref:hypothetical protein n=1 Tax=unclassified Shewanella TaxID=196818 RepID=UPI000C814A59|nr:MULTISPECIES: hypothetical protein [unclassified Shewanella]MDO6617694.1 hypothetical protein [Shewanella sp. 6_MG-2023]MDO6639139.1 hypothetical protein [Shewanella sp. 5_MG-2023]MDO6776270.1 hypothetical protein [Shewanella sp. 3_MG-2023]PMG31118.1 hypothetical protein BCU94_09185 [Shewanella sp. 10N.286.52.C2]PMG42200.1 hypothetical protein BCU91_08790 [Shewanella sp. 10N.286.52.B9]